MKKTLSYQEELLKSLKDPEESIAYLNACLKEDNPKIFLNALRNVIEAHGGITKASKETELNRENLYKMLSEKGNPQLESIRLLLKSIGLNLAVQADHESVTIPKFA